MRRPFACRKAVCLGATLVLVLAAACARTEGVRGARTTYAADVPASPRVIAPGQPIPKGGGVYKVGNPYKIDGILYTPTEERRYDRTGLASFYGEDFHGRKTANGEIFDMWALSAAHPTLPMPSYAYVTNLTNGRTLLVRINDRGPYARGRLIDLSRASARLLGFEARGTAPVRVRYAGSAPLNGDDDHEQRFLAGQSWYRRAAIAAALPLPAR
jgi:rare lipoprotein A